MNSKSGLVRCMVVCGVVLVAGLNGCQLDSDKPIYRDVPISVSGIYTGELSQGRLIHPISGATVTSMNLRQTGDRLEGIDNNGHVFRGRLFSVDANAASFTLEGQTTQGVTGTISGTLDLSSGARMTGTWIEPNLYGDVKGRADVQDTGTALRITPSSATLTTNNETVTFTASGGAGSYSWAVGNTSLGVVAGSGPTVIYTRRAAGNNTVRVTSAGQTVTANINQP